MNCLKQKCGRIARQNKRKPNETSSGRIRTVRFVRFCDSYLGGLCTDSSAFACNGLETRFDASYGTSWSTRFALQEEQTRVLLEDGFRWAAGVTCNVFLDIPADRQDWQFELFVGLKFFFCSGEKWKWSIFTAAKHFRSASIGNGPWWLTAGCRPWNRLYPIQLTKSPINVWVVCRRAPKKNPFKLWSK